MPEAMADRVSPRAPSTARSTTSAELLAPGAIRAVFQPIVRLADLQPIGYEGLARFPTPPGLVALPPDVTLAAAGRLGVREELEVACWAAISEAGAPPAGRLLFVNVAPEALGHPGLMELAERLPARLVIELTEQDAIQNTMQLRERLRPWIARGALVAVDDAGAGFTSLEYVAELRPDFLKLSRGMVTGVDLDPSRLAVLRATVAFAREVGARVVAEGVERPEELEVLREAEVDYGQGWLFGRPAEAWPEEPSARAVAPLRPPAGRLERELAAATNAREASEAIVDHLARKGLMPSVYLEDGGRLRCQAVRGYWQIFDGMPATAGVIGRTFRTGRGDDRRGRRRQRGLPARRRLGARRGLHAPARPRARGRGAQRRVADAPGAAGVAEIERCAGLLAARLDALGGIGPSRPPSSSPAPPSASARSRSPRTSSARPSPPPARSPASSRRCSPSPTATAAGTCTTPRARSPWRWARSTRPTWCGSPPGSTRARRATPPATRAAAGSRATRCCARPAPTP